MGKRFSEKSPSPPSRTANGGQRKPALFVVSSEPAFLESVLSQCADAPSPDDYRVVYDVARLKGELDRGGRVDLAFALIVERDATTIDPHLLRLCKLDHPQLNYVLLLEECEQTTHLRLQSLGVQSIILPPFDKVSIQAEIATALPNVQRFKRHPDLVKRGVVRMDFKIPSDLSYVLGVNHLVSTLLKEFGFPPADCRINLPLVCDEAITNAIVHGNGSNPKKSVSIHIFVSSARFKLRVKDEGEGFNVDEVANPTEGQALMRAPAAVSISCVQLWTWWSTRTTAASSNWKR